MNENVIEFLRDQKIATATFSQGRYVNKIRKLANKRPDDCTIIAENNDGSIVAHIPTDWIRISPNRVVELDDEKRKELQARIEKARKAKDEKRTSG